MDVLQAPCHLKHDVNCYWTGEWHMIMVWHSVIHEVAKVCGHVFHHQGE